MRLTICALALLLLGAEAPTSDPYQIYDRARDAWRKEVYPSDIEYRTTVRVSEGAKQEQQRYNADASLAAGIRVDEFSDVESATPHKASGVNVKVAIELSWNKNAGGSVGSLTQDAHRKEASPDYLGVPLISPEYSFGLGLLRVPEPPAPQGTSAPQGALPTIATVNAVDHAYDITLLGTEALDGFSAYHLRLQPRHEPKIYRLRELWVDTYGYRVLKLVTQGNFTGPPMNAVPWVITFRDIAGATYIDTETAQAPLAFRADRTYATATVSFTDIREADSKRPKLPFIASGEILREP